MILDAHNHICAQKGPVEEQLAELRRTGIDGAVFTPISGSLARTPEALDAGNREALELYEKYPDFLYPGVVVQPEFPEVSRRWLQEFRRAGLVWCGENLSYLSEIPFTDSRWQTLFDFCAAENMVLQLHNAPETAAVAERYPEMMVVASHLDPAVLPLLTGMPNVQIDISGFQGGLVRGSLKNALDMFGVDRLLFGTDFPIYDVEPFVLRGRRDIPVAAQPAFFAENLLTLLRAGGAGKVFGINLQQ